ncbi:hypothetical protein LRY64_04860 [Candidatus Woesebacteria bacterium]|nr:hypothetical protein [Candidatus Woesebacteria bacterium]
MENWTDHGEMSRIVALQVALELEDIESGEWVVVTDSLGSGVIHKGDFNQLSVEVWGSTLQVMNMRNEKPVFSIDSKSSVSLLKKRKCNTGCSNQRW